MKKITVGITSIDPNQFLYDAISSTILSLNSFEYQIIVLISGVDFEIYSNFISKYDNSAISFIYSHSKLSPGRARNIIQLKSMSEYITFLDDDDLIHSNRFNHIFDHITNDYDVIFDNVIRFSSSEFGYIYGFGEQFFHNKKLLLFSSKFNIVNFLIYRMGFLKPIYNLNFLKKNNIFHNENLYRGEDNLFRLNCLLKTNNIIFVNYPGYYYRIRKLSLSALNANHQLASNRICAELLSSRSFLLRIVFYLSTSDSFLLLVNFLLNPIFFTATKIYWFLCRKFLNVNWR